MRFNTGWLLIPALAALQACTSTASDERGSGVLEATTAFLETLSEAQKAKACFPFDSTERYNWHFVPKKRQGIPLEELDSVQYQAAFRLLRHTLSEQGFRKATSIIELENVLKVLEKRAPEDDYRDPGKYYLSIFGEPSEGKVWGWRLEGHHLSLNYTAEDRQLVSATPEFMGANPAIVPEGPSKGLQVLKDEAELAFRLLHSLREDQLKQALLPGEAPADIITTNQRKALLERREGIPFSLLDSEQQAMLGELLNVYIGNFPEEFSEGMLEKLRQSGLDSLHFAWIGSLEPGPGKGHYYRIHSPVLLIEYDNTQNNANHVHTVIRDLTNDFGEDALLKHYKEGHTHGHSGH